MRPAKLLKFSRLDPRHLQSIIMKIVPSILSLEVHIADTWLTPLDKVPPYSILFFIFILHSNYPLRFSIMFTQKPKIYLWVGVLES